MKPELDRLIKAAMKLHSESQRAWRLAVLQNVDSALDILLSKRDTWFPAGAPGEYQDLLNTLTMLSGIVIEEDSKDSSDLIEISEEVIDLQELIEEIYATLSPTFRYVPFTVHHGGDARIVNERDTMKTALMQLFLSLLLFMDHDSSIDVHFQCGPSNIVMEVFFRNIRQEYPADTMEKVFFSYLDGNEYRVTMGLGAPLRLLKSLGVNVRLRYYAPGAVEAYLSFPALAFIETLEKVREKAPLVERRVVRSGTVILAVKEFMLETLLIEILGSNGYHVERATPETLANHHALESALTLITDIPHLQTPDSLRVIMIHDSAADISTINATENTLHLMKPVEVDEIVNSIEGNVHLQDS